MAEGNYRGLTVSEVRQKKEQGLVNVTNNNIFKTKKEIIITHTITYFNFLNLFLGILVLISGQYKNITFMGVIIVNSIIGIIQEMKVKKLVDGLSVITASKARVIRDGEEQEIPIDEVVQEDVVAVANGDQVCADCIVLESDGMEVNESMLTGESKPVRKKEGDKLLSGSFLVAGTGVGKVEHVGEENYAAQLAKKAKTKKRATSEMQRMIKRIIKVLGILIIPIGILLYRSQINVDGATFSESLVGTVAGVIGMIPEGLVLLTSVSFILGVGRLARKRALVQEMEAIEALARVNVLCLDKTGTITTGELEVVELEAVGDEETERLEQVMNEMSYAFDDVNNTQKALMKRFKQTKIWRISGKIPFSSDRKYRAIRFENEGCYVLGAPEFLNKDDEELRQKVYGYSAEGLRVLLLGRCGDIHEDTGEVENVIPVGLVVISDCIRPEAMDTFRYFREQQVDIKVVSGDNPMTVSQIAVKAGLDEIVRDFLLDAFADDRIKLDVLTSLAERNEFNCFGVVICHIYKRITTSALGLGRTKKKFFVQAYARLIAHFSVLDDENGAIFAEAAEKLYAKLAQEGRLECVKNAEVLAAAIYRVSGVNAAGIEGDKIYSFFEVGEDEINKLIN